MNYRPLYIELPEPPPPRCIESDCGRVAEKDRIQCERCRILDEMIAYLDALNNEPRLHDTQV
jgi:hypothetical protein